MNKFTPIFTYLFHIVLCSYMNIFRTKIKNKTRNKQMPMGMNLSMYNLLYVDGKQNIYSIISTT